MGDLEALSGMLTEIGTDAATASGAPTELLGGFLHAVVAAVAGGRGLEHRAVDQCFRRGRAAARQGVALRALIDLHLRAIEGLWPRLPGVVDARRPDAVIGAGHTVFGLIDEAVGALTEGYQVARREVVREQEAARRELVDDLLLGGVDVASLVERAVRFGLDLSGPHAVAVIRAERAFGDATGLTRTVERAILGRKGDADALVASKDGRLVVVFAAPDTAAIEQVSDRLAEVMGPQPEPRPDVRPSSRPVVHPGAELAAEQARTSVRLRRSAGLGRWQLGVGLSGTGPVGVRSSYEQALEALQIADRIGLDRDVVNAADLRLFRLLLADRAALAALVDGVLGPLAAARGGAQPLLDTLRAYAFAGGNASATARALHLSVRAVTYRLDRIGELTGYHPNDPQDRLQLQVAALAAQLVDHTILP